MNESATPFTATDYLVDGVVEFLSALSPREFAAIVAAARPPGNRPDDPAEVR